ncbi:MAG TPA: hypothetical protein EYN79_00645, partial [Planctomycetes bacterium]|nr:hypothetical protein [Planctomycetota bacterium]
MTYRFDELEEDAKLLRFLSDSMIVAGDTIFVGGRDAVAAYSTDDGQEVWRSAVRGRAFSLAAANGRLVVSTDAGQIHCFSASTISGKPVASGARVVSDSDAEPETPVPDFDDPSLLSRWVFQKNTIGASTVKDLAGDANATIVGDVVVRPAGKVHALALDGVTHSVLVAADHSEMEKMPTAELTAEAWVRIDRQRKYGGIVGAIQDNGDFERGWLLGYGGTRFNLALTGSDGNGKMTYLSAGSDFILGGWHHVVGSYDGETMRLYVDGVQSSESSAQKGAIFYPPQAFYEIGAYHDKDEYFRLAGMVREVRVFDRALDASEIARHHQEQKGLFPPPGQLEGALLSVGPYLRFDSASSATVHWQTQGPSPSILEYRLGSEVKTVEVHGDRREHSVRITGLANDRIYHYRIRARIAGEMIETAEAEIDTYFNYNTPAVSDLRSPFENDDGNNAFRAAALEAIESAVTDQGICIVYGTGTGQLAYEIARNSRFRVIAIDDDQATVVAARYNLRNSRFLGSRISFHQ